jgi:D-sedoheptulose 7-phosphate isomerase
VTVDAIAEHAALVERVRALLPDVDEVAAAIARSVKGGGRLFTFGNGGSAADAQHFAAELLGRFRRDRAPLAATALTTDPSTMTAIANDYAFADVFARQLTALARKGDVAVGITTSGNSENVVKGLKAAKEQGALAVVLSGGDGGAAATEADRALVVPSKTTARIQEMHLLLIHMLCERIDQEVIGR